MRKQGAHMVWRSRVWMLAAIALAFSAQTAAGQSTVLGVLESASEAMPAVNEIHNANMPMH